MFPKALSSLFPSRKSQSPELPKNPAHSLVRRFSKAVADVFRLGGPKCESPLPKASGDGAKEVSDAAFALRVSELRKDCLDERFSAWSRDSLAKALDAIEERRSRSELVFASEWGVLVESAADALVDVSELSALYRDRLSEIELADISQPTVRLRFYRTLDLAKAALQDPSVSESSVRTLVSVLKREGAAIREEPRVARTLSLRASFADFRNEIETMDFRQYAIGGLKAMSADFQAVLEASKDETWAPAYDAAVSKLFRSFSELVHLPPLKSALGDWDVAIAKNSGYLKRWGFPQAFAMRDALKGAISNPEITKKEADAILASSAASLEEFRAKRDLCVELDRVLMTASSVNPADFSKASYGALSEFVSKTASARDAFEIENLVSEWKEVLSALVDVSRLRTAVLKVHRKISSVEFRNRYPEIARTALQRLDFACEILAKPAPKAAEVSFVASSLECLSIPDAAPSSVNRVSDAVKRAVRAIFPSFAILAR